MDNKSIGCSCHQRELSLQDRLEKGCRSEDALLKEVARLKCEMGGARARHEDVVRLKKENQKLKENMTGILDTIYDNPNNPKTTGTYDLLGDIGDIVEEILKLKENSDCHYSDEELHNSSDEEQFILTVIHVEYLLITTFYNRHAQFTNVPTIKICIVLNV